jgi:hypothetical protein
MIIAFFMICNKERIMKTKFKREKKKEEIIK